MSVDTGPRRAYPGWPESRIGHWSVGLGAVLVASLALAGILLGVGLRGAWLYAFPGLVVLAGACGALSTAAVAYLREHERSLAVVFSGLLGGLVLAALAGELAFVV